MPALSAESLVPIAGDTLAGHTVASLPDTIPSAMAATLPDSAWTEPFRHLSPAEIFGLQSQLAPDPAWMPDAASGLAMMTDSLIYKLFVVAVFAVYCYMLFYYRDSFAALIKSLRSRLFREKLIEEMNYTFASFLRMVGGTGLMACSVLIIRCAALFAGQEGEAVVQRLPVWGTGLLTVVAAAVILSILLYQHLLLRAVGGLIRAPLFFEHLRSLRRIVATGGALFIIPLVLIFALAPEPAAGKILYSILIVLLFFAVLFVGQSYRHFAGQNVSIFYWILYLCAVEIFPVSIFAALVLRNL